MQTKDDAIWCVIPSHLQSKTVHIYIFWLLFHRKKQFLFVYVDIKKIRVVVVTVNASASTSTYSIYDKSSVATLQKCRTLCHSGYCIFDSVVVVPQMMVFGLFTRFISNLLIITDIFLLYTKWISVVLRYFFFASASNV